MSDEWATLLDRYEAGAELMRGALGLVPRELWDTAPAPGEWTARQVFVHFADSELVGAGRIRQLLAEDGPTLFFYRQDEWARNLDYSGASAEEAVALAVVVRRATARLLRHVVRDETWGRRATHPTRGEMDLAALLRLYIGHVEGHIAQIEAIASGGL
ncbi:MAG TPA: DinB family protein [Chloroflexaceae bacterium]|nr:DinB family protein [Chloroflexaceae bacterium]